MVFHYSLYAGLNWVEGGPLAVDLFFVLSGLVIAHAYQKRLEDGLTFAEFARLRLTRLLPLHAFSIFMGALAMLAVARNQALVDSSEILQAFLFNVVLLPLISLTSWPAGGHLEINPLFPLNPPAWSLFYEFAANFGYVALVKLHRPWIRRTVLALAIVACLDYAITWGHSNAGWNLATLFSGFPRVFCGFLLGVTIYRRQWHRLSYPPWLIAAAALCLTVGLFRGHVLLSIVVPMVAVPLLIAGLASVPVSGKLLRACELASASSYPLYVIHFPLYRLAAALLPLEAIAPEFRIALMATAALGAAALVHRPDRLYLGWLRRGRTAQSRLVQQPSRA